MVALSSVGNDFGDNSDDHLFARIADDLQSKGYSINPAVLPANITDAWLAHIAQMESEKFEPAGIGREQQHMLNNFVRSDEICWISGQSAAGRLWLDWTTRLQQYLNRRLFLGLFSFESHIAHYAPGDYYKRHLDAFQGEVNRVLSMVVYLNSQWCADDGGELLLYQDEHDQQGIVVIPGLGTVVVFLSEQFPHEVLPVKRHRYSIAGWFRVNTSTGERVDPPV